MNEASWIQLWLLNELVCDRCRLSDLMQHPEATTHLRGNWNFPERAAIEATADARIEALESCVKSGLVEIYSGSWLSEKRFGEYQPCSAGFDFRTTGCLNSYEAILTLKGHQQWERDFQPDWKRYWLEYVRTHNDNTGEESISILYSSDEMLDDIVQWFPFLARCDAQFGMKELETFTLFQYQATVWHVLPCAKVTKWRVQNGFVEMKNLIQPWPSPDSSDDNSIKKAAQRKAAMFLDELGYRSEAASHILCRLSKKWDAMGNEIRSS